jgi:hypothetical protein
MALVDSLPRFLFPTRRRGVRWLRELLHDLGVTAPLSPSCLDEFVMSAADAAVKTRTANQTYAAALKKQLEARARFVQLWTNTDGELGQPEYEEFIPTARKHLLPRSWAITQTSATFAHNGNKAQVPSRLIVKARRNTHRPQPVDAREGLPGVEILSDLKRAGDKK